MVPHPTSLEGGCGVGFRVVVINLDDSFRRGRTGRWGWGVVAGYGRMFALHIDI